MLKMKKNEMNGITYDSFSNTSMTNMDRICIARSTLAIDESMSQ